MNVAIIDYGMGNIGSVSQAIMECGFNVKRVRSGDELTGASHIILPGVGAFGDGMAHLHERGFVTAVREIVFEKKVPFLGICLGMQLLADKGMEGEECEGLGLIHGRVVKFEPIDKSVRVPHVGWNELYSSGDSILLEGIASGTDFYFVHSYHFVPVDDSAVLGTTPYNKGFVSVVGAENVFGTQFHPEKSSKAGMVLLKNFLSL